MNMRYITVLTLSLIMFSGVTNSTTLPSINKDVTQLPISNIRASSNMHFSGGQPSQESLAALVNVGVKHIINLRPQSEQKWNEKSYVESLGANYYLIPVAGIDDLSEENANKLGNLLTTLSNEYVFVHCASGNRVGALIALHEGIINQSNIETAVEKGKHWGLTRLEPLVRNELTKMK